jgi:hypothetical protein
MNINVIIASHLDKYRYYTIKQCFSSINDCIKYAGLHNINVYLSYSYNEEIEDKIEVLEEYLRSFEYIIPIIYKHKENKIQFRHIEYIINNNNFDDNDWIMFHDDDDISMVNRLSEFIKLIKLYNYIEYFESYMIAFDRSIVLHYPYGDFYNKDDHFVLQDRSDFATIITKVKIIRDFLQSNTIWNHYPLIVQEIYQKLKEC